MRYVANTEIYLISTSKSDSFLSASVLASLSSLLGETCWGKSSMFRDTPYSQSLLARACNENKFQNNVSV